MASLSSRALGLAALLFVAAMALYGRVAGNEFLAIDDPGYLENRWVAAGLTWKGVGWAFTHEHSSNWHPLTWLSHMLDSELFGRSPVGPHLVNAALHALGTALLFLFLELTTARRIPSLLVALLFAAHPQRVESVAWVAERKDVLSACFFFAVLLAYARHARRPSRGRLAVVWVLAALGLLAKPMLVTLPCVLLLVDLWPLGRWRPGTSGLGRLVLEKVPLFLLSAGSIAATLLAQARAFHDLEALPLGTRLANALVGWMLYVEKFVWPVRLAVYYPHPALSSPTPPPAWSATAVGAGLALALLSAAAWSARRRLPVLTTGWFWYFGMLVPVIGIVQVGGQQIADRYAYLPQVGLLLALVFGLDALTTDARRRRGLTLIGAAAVLACAGLTWHRIGVWRTTETLFRDTLAVTERNAFVHANLGLWYLERGDFEAAIEQLEARLELGTSSGFLVNLGVAQQRAGQEEAALHSYEEALRLDPDLFQAHANLATTRLARGQARQAIPHFEAALRQRPRSAELRAGLERARTQASAGSR